MRNRIIAVVVLLFVVSCTLFVPVSAENFNQITVVNVNEYSEIPFDNLPANTVYIFPLDTAPQNAVYSITANANVTTSAPDDDTPRYNANANKYVFAGSCDSDEDLYSADYLTGNIRYTIYIENLKWLFDQTVECYNYNNRCILTLEIPNGSGAYGLVEPNYQTWYFKFPGSCNVEGWVKGGNLIG